MRNAALVLGIIGGIWAMFVGFFGFGYTQFIESHGAIGTLATQVQNPGLIRAASFLAPLLAIAGGAMARARNRVAAVLLWASAAAVYAGFGFNVFTMFPIGFCALGGALALAAKDPDPH